MTEISITGSIPHRDPMLLIDEVIRHTADEIVCRRTFRGDEYFFQGHYPDYPLVPGVILCECAAQAAALLIANQNGPGGVSAGQVPGADADEQCTIPENDSIPATRLSNCHASGRGAFGCLVSDRPAFV